MGHTRFELVIDVCIYLYYSHFEPRENTFGYLSPQAFRSKNSYNSMVMTDILITLDSSGKAQSVWRINKYFLEGKTYWEIAALSGRAISTIQNYKSRYNLPKTRFLGNKGLNKLISLIYLNKTKLDYTEYPYLIYLSEILGIDQQTVVREYQELLIAKCSFLINSGIQLNVCSKLLGINIETVRAYREKENIKISNLISLSKNNGPRSLSKVLQKSNDLAEIVGILLGDGHIGYNGYISISLNERDYFEYVNYVENLVFITLNHKFYRGNWKGNPSCTRLSIRNVSLVSKLEKIGLYKGKKRNNKTDVPVWILKSVSFQKRCIKGLFDTDGSIINLNSQNGKIKFRLKFTNKVYSLIEFFHKFCVRNDIVANIVKDRNVFDVVIDENRSKQRFLELVNPEKLKYAFWKKT